MSYHCVLTNPFDCFPVRLGGEMMQPSGLATLNWRGQITLPSSGNASYVFYPWASGSFITSSTASSPYTYGVVSGPYPGSSALAALAPNGRIVASGLRVVTTASATNNQGVVTIGCLPRSAVRNATDVSVTLDGFPTQATTVATQGFNEFFNFLQTESYPLKDGASAFYRPEDPLDYTFRDITVQSPADLAFGEDLQPFIVVGVTGAAASSVLLFELVTHIEYTVTTGTTGVVNTGRGDMAQQDLIDVAKGVVGDAVDSTIAGVVGGLDLKTALIQSGVSAVKGVGRAGLRYLANAASAYSNSNNLRQ